MRILMKVALLSGLAAASAGCGGAEEPITDPSQLPPLTEEQEAEIQARDAEIADEEQQGGVVPPG
ncbi:hypothetical protein [Tautonia plasticadhaerens]|uniref:Secreted protein n=1 Tax=Tautonia plasticadhaerens TaxID=2527974 RepID=A0A518GWF5_9BACT|nr:hypothetical protein [Tautonia plasticadhaerens]QDV32925.1 hypothetical protein ElP_07670 [Tautonia plasticadhaerens]